jgi:hypothetical protein
VPRVYRSPWASWLRAVPNTLTLVLRPRLVLAVRGGRSWWARRKSIRINIELTFLQEKAEDYSLNRDTCWCLWTSPNVSEHLTES